MVGFIAVADQANLSYDVKAMHRCAVAGEEGIEEYPCYESGLGKLFCLN